MQRNKIQIENAVDLMEHQKTYDYAWIQEIGKVTLDKTKKDSPMIKDLNELLEARFFSASRELHVFWHNDHLCAIETITEEKDTQLTKDSKPDKYSKEGCHYFQETHALRKTFGILLQLRHFIEHDPDGLAYIGHTVLCGLTKEG